MPAHHHCVVSVEAGNHPKHWVDAIDELLDGYTPDGPPDEPWAQVGHAQLPTLWQRLPNTLGRGRWAMETFQLGPGRKLVLQLLGYADRGQPTLGSYTVCDRHQRPDDAPHAAPDRPAHATR